MPLIVAGPTCVVNGPEEDVERYSLYPARSGADTPVQLSWIAPPTTVAVRPIGIGGAVVSWAVTVPDAESKFPAASPAHTTIGYACTIIGRSEERRVGEEWSGR